MSFFFRRETGEEYVFTLLPLGLHCLLFTYNSLVDAEIIATCSYYLPWIISSF